MNAYIMGGSRGIGAAAVRLFCARGWNTAFTYLLSEKEARSLASEFEGHTMPFRADGASWQQSELFAAAAEERFGPPDVLIYCAGISHIGLFQQMSEAEWDRLMDVNLKGAAGACRAVIPGMVRRRSGSIILVSSMWGQVGASCEAAYSASKAGVIGLAKALAKELGPSGVRVNCVAPGVIETDMNSGLDRASLDELAERTPLGRLGTPLEVAETMIFLAESAFITGQVICPNGGFVI